MSGAALVRKKTLQSGDVYSTEKDRKRKIALRQAPPSLLILEQRYLAGETFASVTSLYQFPTRLDGTLLGRYKPILVPPAD
jgi:hypothetical protein